VRVGEAVGEIGVFMRKAPVEWDASL
jgi:hypothetical protein